MGRAADIRAQARAQVEGAAQAEADAPAPGFDQRLARAKASRSSTLGGPQPGPPADLAPVEPAGSGLPQQVAEASIAPLPEGAPKDPKLRAVAGAAQGAAGMVDAGQSAMAFLAGHIFGPGVQAAVEDGDVNALNFVKGQLEQQGITGIGGEGDIAGKLGEEVGAGLTIPGGAQVRGAQGLANIGGATGAALGREVLGDESVVGALGGGVAGSFAPKAIQTAAITTPRALSAAADLPRGKVSQRRALRQAAEITQSSVNDRNLALAELDRVEELRTRFPGFDPSSGAASGDPGLRTLERDAAVRPFGDGPNALNFEQARARGNEALRREMISLRPNFGSEEEARAAVRAMIDRRLETIPTAPDGVAASKEARAQFDTLHQEFRTEVGGEFDRIEAAAASRGVLLPVDPIARGLADIRRELSQSERLRIPGQVVRVIDEADKITGKVLPFSEIRGMERRLNDELKNANLSPTARRQIGKLKESIDTALDNMGAPGSGNPTIEQRKALEALGRHNGLDEEFLELAQQYRDTKAAFREGSLRFEKGLGGQLSGQRDGRPITAIEETLDMFLRTDAKGASRARQFKEVYGDSPEALSTMSDFIVSKALRGVVDEAGIIKPTSANAAKIRSFMAKNKDALDAFPDARERVRNFKNLTAEAEAAGILGNPRSREAIEQGALRLFMDEPSAAVRKIFDLDPARQAEAVSKLASPIARDPNAMAGLRSVVMDDIIGRVTRQDSAIASGRTPSIGVSAKALQEVLIESRPALTKIFPAEHLDSLDALLEAAFVNERQISGFASRAGETAVPGILDVARTSGIGNRLLSNRVRVLRGASLVSRIFKSMSSEQANLIIRRAATDTELMRDLLTRVTPASRARLARKLGRNVPADAFRALSTDSEPQPAAGGLQ